MTNYARIEPRSAPLSSEFGLSYAVKAFGLPEAEIAARVGRFVRGKRKGQIRGHLEWRHVVRGGWESETGRPLRPGQRFGHKLYDGKGRLICAGKVAPEAPSASRFAPYRHFRREALKAIAASPHRRQSILNTFMDIRRIAGLSRAAV